MSGWCYWKKKKDSLKLSEWRRNFKVEKQTQVWRQERRKSEGLLWANRSLVTHFVCSPLPPFPFFLWVRLLLNSAKTCYSDTWGVSAEPISLLPFEQWHITCLCKGQVENVGRIVGHSAEVRSRKRLRQYAQGEKRKAKLEAFRKHEVEVGAKPVIVLEGDWHDHMAVVS